MAEGSKNGKWQGLVVGAIILLVIAFFVLRKNKSFSGEHEFYAYYTNVKGLQPSSPVQLRGVRVGKISDIDLNGGGKVRITLRMKKGVELPTGTTALLASGNILGDKVIRLVPGTGPGNIPDQSIITAAYDTSVMQMTTQVGPYIQTAKLILKSADTGLRGFSLLLQSQLLSKTIHGLIAIENSMDAYSLDTRKWNENIDSTITSIRDINESTASLDSATRGVKDKLRPTNDKTKKIAQKELRQSVQELKASMTRLGSNFKKLNDDTGSYVNSKHAYTNMSNSFDTLNKGWKESYRNPQGFSIFGGKKKK